MRGRKDGSMAEGATVEASRIELRTAGFVQSCSIDKAKPGKVVVKLELERSRGLMEKLAELADRQLAIAVHLCSMQTQLPFRQRLAEAGPPEEEETE